MILTPPALAAKGSGEVVTGPRQGNVQYNNNILSLIIWLLTVYNIVVLHLIQQFSLNIVAPAKRKKLTSVEKLNDANAQAGDSGELNL